MILNIKIAKVWDNYILQFIGKGGKPLWEERANSKEELAISLFYWITNFAPEDSEMDFNAFDLLEDLHIKSDGDVK